MEIDYIKRFVVVGQTLNFRKAADQLFISQPTLSHSISKLEEQVGITLLNRNTKTVTLTPAGESFLAISEEFLEHFDSYEKDIASIVAKDKPSKDFLRIGYMGPAIDSSFTPLIKEFHSANPSVDIQIINFHSQAIADALENHDIQLAVLFNEYIKDVPQIRSQVIMKERFQLCVNSQHPLANETSVTMEQLKDVPIIICKRSAAPYYYDRIMRIFASHDIIPNIQQEVDQMSDIFRMINIGMGVGILSFSGNTYYKNLDLHFIDIDGIVNKSHDKVIAWYESNISSTGNKLIKFIKQHSVNE